MTERVGAPRLGFVCLAGFMAVGVLGACNGDAPQSSPPTASTTDASLEARLLVPADLGVSFEETSTDGLALPCTLDVDEPTLTAKRSFVSNPAQQLVRQQLLRFADVAASARAFDRAMASSACEPSEFGDADGKPLRVVIAGADQAFDVSFADELNGMAVTVARVGEIVVTIETKVHQAGTDDGVGTHDLMVRAVARLD